MKPDDAYDTPTENATTDHEDGFSADATLAENGSPDADQYVDVDDDSSDQMLDVGATVDEPIGVESDDEIDAEVAQARQAFDGEDPATLEDWGQDSGEDAQRLAELATPFVGQWNQLISTTNWEKGRIISQWRAALIESDAGSDQYSDEAWARRVGGVTAPHVGRLRRVFDRFENEFSRYDGLYWSHFLAALDWEDAPLWLEGAVQSGWSVAGMREQRWQAHGAVDSQRPTASQIIDVDLDEDITDTGTQPAQGAGTREYGDEPGTTMGKSYENADFGDEDEFQSLAGPSESGAGGNAAPAETGEPSPTPVQPFVGLPELPDDLADAIEMMKLAILRHKSNKWESIDIDVVAKYLEAIGVLMRSP